MSTFPTKILLAVDGSGDADVALRSTVDLVEKTGSELHVTYVGEAPFVYHPEHHAYQSQHEEHERMAVRILEEQVEKVKATGGNVAGIHPALGRPDIEIVDLAEELGVDLIIVGSRGLGGVKRALMGSVSDSVVRHAHCPVLVVRS